MHYSRPSRRSIGQTASLCWCNQWNSNSIDLNQLNKRSKCVQKGFTRRNKGLGQGLTVIYQLLAPCGGLASCYHPPRHFSSELPKLSHHRFLFANCVCLCEVTVSLVIHLLHSLDTTNILYILKSICIFTPYTHFYILDLKSTNTLPWYLG